MVLSSATKASLRRCSSSTSVTLCSRTVSLGLVGEIEGKRWLWLGAGSVPYTHSACLASYYIGYHAAFENGQPYSCNAIEQRHGWRLLIGTSELLSGY